MDLYCYDAAGNQLDDGPCIQSGPQKYAYDAEGRLASTNFGQTTYVYDAEGNRVAKADASGNVSNWYLYDVVGHMVEETDGSFNPLRTEIYAGSRHLATYLDQAKTLYYAHTNWLGTESARSDANGNLCETLSSLPFGDNQQISGTCSPTPNFFTGKERDTESGNDYFGGGWRTLCLPTNVGAPSFCVLCRRVGTANLAPPSFSGLWSALTPPRHAAHAASHGQFFPRRAQLALQPNVYYKVSGSPAAKPRFSIAST